MFEPNLIHTSRQYGKRRWFDRMLAPIFEDILTLRIISRYHITHTTIVSVKVTDIWGRYKEPMVKVIEYNHFQEDIDFMWTGCLTTRKAMVEVYGTIPMYLTTAQFHHRFKVRQISTLEKKSGT